MQRYGVPFDYIEDNWTESQFLCVVAAIQANTETIENEREAVRNTGDRQGPMKPSQWFLRRAQKQKA